jgi:prepilin-type processing-associated H-X9-DG protein
MEVLVVIAIIAILVGLILPAVQRARAAAARAQCSNNLRQLGLAAHQYHNQQRVLPAGMRYQGRKDPYLFSSWLVALLPYIEQRALWEQTQQAYQKLRNPFVNPPHVGLATVLPILVCPADGRGDQVQFASLSKKYVALTSYLGVEGSDLRSNDGVLFRDSHICFADITDGLSNTLLAGERPPSPNFQYGWWYAGAGQKFTGSADMVLGVLEQNILVVTAGSCAPGYYPYGPGSLTNPCDMYHFWSLHDGGANFLFVDGSVRFIGYGAASIMPALASRAGAETVPPMD